MALQSDERTAALLLVLGVVLIWIAVGTGGPETTVVHEYTAFEVEYDDELVLTDQKTGGVRDGIQAEHANVDDRIACLPSYTRQCGFERQAIDGEIAGEGIGSDYWYVYLDGKFYRIVKNGTIEYDHERRSASEAFAELAIDPSRLTDREREALADGRTISSEPFPNTNRLVRYDGRYYTLLNTASKVYGDGGSFCSSSGNGFCGDADTHRRGLWLRNIAVGFLGVLGTVVGGRNLIRAYRSKANK